MAFVVVPTLSIDSIGAALALALSLKKAGKEVKVFCPQKTDQNYSKLSGLELLVDNYTNSDLIVSLDYPIDQIEAVSYNDDGGHLNLVVKPNLGLLKSKPIKLSSIIMVPPLMFVLCLVMKLPLEFLPRWLTKVIGF